MSDTGGEKATDEAGQFDFLQGDWSARCRFPLPDGTWGEGPGSLKASRVLGGCVSLEFFEGPYQGGARIQGLGLRAFNPRTSLWEHTWTDTSAPGGFQVWRGHFQGGSIDLLGEWEESGQVVLSRLTWSRITERSAHWESHRSTDGGKTWTKHWEIDFERR